MADTARRPENRYGNRPTMKDVAARAGVGLKTVSRVVNAEPGVTPETERRVQEAIDALGFRRNDSARVLRKGSTASIGLVLEDLADPFYGPLSRAVEEIARAHGALLINGSSAEDPDREQELVLALCARRVDGLVIIPAGDDHRYLEPELKAGVATVFVDRPAGKIDADVVLSDSFGGARDGVAHLISHGHRRIGFIGDMPRIHTSAERLRGYRAAMEDAGIAVEGPWMSLGVTDPERVRRAAEEMLAGPSPVTAIFAGNNRVTVTVVRVLNEQRRPVALVGFDDFELADLLQPGVTVVAQDAAQLGRTAAERLFRQLDGTLMTPERIELPTRLITRGSGELRRRSEAGMRTLESLGLAEAPRDHPLDLPGRVAAESGVLDGDHFLPLPVVPSLTFLLSSPDRVPVLAVGSNASPGQLRHKMVEYGISAPLPMTRARVTGIEVGVSAHVSLLGYVSASPFDAPGNIRELFVTWLDAEQLAVIDASEGVTTPTGPYDRAWLPSSEVSVKLLDSGERLPGVYAYVNRRGVLHDGSGSPRRHPGERRLLTELLDESPGLRELFGATPEEFCTGPASTATGATGVPGCSRRRGWSSPPVWSHTYALSRPGVRAPGRRCRRPVCRRR